MTICLERFGWWRVLITVPVRAGITPAAPVCSPDRLGPIFCPEHRRSGAELAGRLVVSLINLSSGIRLRRGRFRAQARFVSFWNSLSRVKINSAGADAAGLARVRNPPETIKFPFRIQEWTAAQIASAGCFSPLGPRRIAIVVIDYAQREFLHRIGAVIRNYGDEGNPLAKEIVCRL
jgi:hypothetical protein